MYQLRGVTPAAALVSIAWKAAHVVTLALVVLALWARPVRADDVLPGIDLFVTPPNGTSVDFSFPPGPLPAGFFDPGSDPFGGAIQLTGQPLLTAPPGIISPVDTIVERLAQATLPVCGSSDTIPIEIVALSLTSSSPIVVTYNGGMNPELWDVDAALSSLFPQNLGSMTINHDGATCGTFTAVLPVTPKLVFTRQSDFATRTLDLGIPFLLNTANGHWVHTPALGILTTPGGFLVDRDGDGITETGPVPGSGPNFYPGLQAVPCDCTMAPTSVTAVATLESTQDGAEQHTVFPPVDSALWCGDGIVGGGEECDPPGGITCPAGSPAGAFLPCSAQCTCEQPTCGNGVLEGSEECDPPGSITCPAGSPGGAFLPCGASCSCCVPSPEICNNMLDDDCDGEVDCDDVGSCPQPCPDIQKDPSKIIFGPPGAGLDVFKSHGRVEPGETVDMSNSDVGWVLSNQRGVIWSGTLVSSDFVANATGTTFRYKNLAAKTGGGIFKGKIRISRGGTSYGFRVQAYGDLSAATDPNMSIQFYLGVTPKAYIHSEPWTRTKTGWKADGF